MTTNQSLALGFGATQLLESPASYARRSIKSATKPITSSDRYRNQKDINAQEALITHETAAYHLVVTAAYRQIFGNVRPMESERLLSAESQLLNGDITVREFVRCLALSSFYRTRFYDAVSPHRAVELNFKHLLGRPPQDEDEVATHIEIIASAGFEGEIRGYLDSDEYLQTFGEDTVPYPTSWNSPIGQPQSAFNRIAALEQSFASSDTANGKTSQLLTNLAKGNSFSIKVPSHVHLSAMRGTIGWSSAGGGLNSAGLANHPSPAIQSLWRYFVATGGFILTGLVLWIALAMIKTGAQG